MSKYPIFHGDPNTQEGLRSLLTQIRNHLNDNEAEFLIEQEKWLDLINDYEERIRRIEAGESVEQYVDLEELEFDFKK